MAKRKKKKTIRSDPEVVNRLLNELKQRNNQPSKRVSVYKTRQYHNGPNARPYWPAQGGLPSLGKGY